MTLRRHLFVLLLAVCLAGCAAQTTTTGAIPSPPTQSTPPQIIVANSVLALSHAVVGATDALIACRTQTKCSAADVSAAENVIAAIATTGKQIDGELNSTVDPWPIQQKVILKLVTDAGLGQLKGKVSAPVQIFILSVVTLFNSISAAVGGPTV